MDTPPETFSDRADRRANADDCDEADRHAEEDTHADNASSVETESALLNKLLAGHRDRLWRTPAGKWTAALAEEQQPSGLLSGSFNPLHEGHVELQRVAQRLLGGPVHFELSVLNADKPPLGIDEIRRRAVQFAGEHLVVSTAATFAEKAVLFPGTVFVVGYDTAERILQSRFYGHAAGQMQRALAEVAAAGCRFLVAGRFVGRRFCTLADLEIPVDFRRIFEEIPVSQFRCDISSTAIRRGKSNR